jgi:hypothetical protein
VLVLAAAGMSSSVAMFRWTYDNNPLIPFALACAVASAIWLTARFTSPVRRVGASLVATAVLALSALCWATLGDQVWLARSSNQRWPEVAHLRGARLRPKALEVRRLVAVVRGFAGSRERVLLLPEDPNVEAWFERPRPRLSSAIVFVDQYWDRYVDADFARLEAAPPKVIVIGPRYSWRAFAHAWHRGWGAERLIDRVEGELLPRRYVLRRSLPFEFRRFRDRLDVWVRK